MRKGVKDYGILAGFIIYLDYFDVGQTNYFLFFVLM